MKTLISLCVFLSVFSTFLTGQSYYGGSAATVGFGSIGVVASENNYQSAYFQNPALLARNNHRIDAFANYADLGFGSTISSGVMLNFNKNAIGFVFQHFSSDFLNTPTFAYNTIPLLYARSLYQTEKAGISVGANLNIINTSFRYWLNSQLSSGSDTYLTGGLGINAYRILKLNNQHSLSFNIGSSINNVGPDATFNGYIITSVQNHYKIGGMIGWEWSISETKKFNFNTAYQFSKVPEFYTILGTFEGMQHLGVEIKYNFAVNMYWAIRGGIVWDQYSIDTQHGYTTFGGTLSIKGFYLDLAILPQIHNRIANMQKIGLGYQKALN